MSEYSFSDTFVSGESVEISKSKRMPRFKLEFQRNEFLNSEENFDTFDVRFIG